MSSQVTEKITVVDDQGNVGVSGSLIAVGSTVTSVSQAFAAGSSAVAVALAFATASLKYIALKSTQDMTVVVNLSAGGPITINLLAGIAWRWNSTDGYFANPFSANVTSLSVSCTPAAILTARVLV